MEGGGISRRLIKFCDSLLGWLPGGLGMVAILTCMFFAAISGSGPATVAAIGGIMIETNPEDITRIVPAEELLNTDAVLAVAAQ